MLNSFTKIAWPKRLKFILFAFTLLVGAPNFAMNMELDGDSSEDWQLTDISYRPLVQEKDQIIIDEPPADTTEVSHVNPSPRYDNTTTERKVKDANWSENIGLTPIVFAEGMRSRFITALPSVNSIESESSTQNDGALHLTNAEVNGSYLVQDYKQGMAFVALVAGVPFLCGGLVALFEGDLISHRKVLGLKNGQEIDRLKRPKNASDVELWNVGDRLQYSIGIGGLLPVGVGAIVIGAGVAPLIKSRWQVSIEKLSDTEIKVDFAKEQTYGIKAGAGTFIINSDISITKENVDKQSYTVNIKTASGKKQLSDLMRYRHMFRGGIKDIEKHRDKDSKEVFIHKNNDEKIKKLDIDRKYIRTIIPFIFKWNLGKTTTHGKTKEFNRNGEDGTRTVYFDRNTHYGYSMSLNNILSKKYRKSLHRERQLNGITQGTVTIDNGQWSISAEANASFSTNHLEQRSYNRNMRLLDRFFSLNQSITKKLIWGNESKFKGTFIVSVNMKIHHDDIFALMAKRLLLRDCLDSIDHKRMGKARSSLNALINALDALQLEIGKDESNNEKIASLLRAVMDRIRQNYDVIKAVDSLVPGALRMSIDVSGTHILPVRQRMTIL